MKDDLSQMEDDLSRLTKRLHVQGGNDEITLGFDKILGRLADHLELNQPPPNFIQRAGGKLSAFFNGILRRP